MKSKRSSALLPIALMAVFLSVAGCGGGGGGGGGGQSAGDGTSSPQPPKHIELKIVSPELNSLHNTASPELTYTATEDSDPIPESRIEASVGDLQDNEIVSSIPVPSVASGSLLPTLNEGRHMLEFIINSEGGDRIFTVTVAFATDTIKPVVVIEGLQDIIADSTPVIVFSTDEEGETTIFLDGSPIEIESGGTLTNPDGTPLEDGKHIITIVVTDEAQNAGVTTIEFVVDTTPPVVDVENNLPDDGVTNTTEDLVFTSDEDGSATVTVDGEVIKFTVDGESVDSIDVDAGEDVVVVIGDLEPGEHTIVIVIEDEVENTQVTEINFTFDPNAPSVTISEPVGLINTPTFQLNCFVEDESTDPLIIAISVDAYDPDADSWTSEALNEQCGDQITIDKDGQYRLVVSATDASGNTGIATSEFSIDSTAPVVQITAPPAGATDNPAPLLVYQSTEEGTEQVSIGNAATSGSMEPINVRSGAALGPLADGSYKVLVEITDAAGNAGEATVTFSIDATAPSVSITAPLDGSTIASVTPTLDYTTGEGGSAVVTVNGVATEATAVADGEQVSMDLGELPEGANTISVAVTDTLGNVEPVSVSFTIDPNAPELTVTNPTGLYTTKTVPLSYEVTDEFTVDDLVEIEAVLELLTDDGAGGMTVALAVDIDDAKSGSITVQVDGDYRVRMTATDLVGNNSEASSSFRVDTTPPTVGILSPENGETTSIASPMLLIETSDEVLAEQNIYLFSGDFRDNYGSAELTSLQINQPITNADGSSLSEGTYTIVVEVKDAAGWSSSAASTFTVDAVGPSVSIESPTNGDTLTTNVFTLLYSAHNASHVELWIDGELISERVIDPVEPDSISYEENLQFAVDGEFEILLRAREDSNDIHEADQDTISVVVDALNSVVTIISPSISANQFNGEVPVEFKISSSISAAVRLDGVIIQEYTGLGGSGSEFSDAFTIGPFTDNKLYVLEVSAFDGMATVTEKAVFLVDTVGPDVTIDNPLMSAVIDNDVFTLSYSIEEANEVASESVWLDGTLLENTESGSVIGPLADGSYTIEVHATDTAGNDGNTASVTFSIENFVPPPPEDDPPPPDDDPPPPDDDPPPPDDDPPPPDDDPPPPDDDDDDRPGRRWGSSCILDALSGELDTMAELRECIEERRQNDNHDDHDDDDDDDDHDDDDDDDDDHSGRGRGNNN